MDFNAEECKDVFPPGTKIISFTGTSEKFEAIVRCRCRDKDDFFESWLKPYQVMNNVGLRTSVTRPRTGKVVLYKAVFRCQHNTYPHSHQRVKKSHKKHTDCPALVKVTIKAPTDNRRVRDKDALRSEFPTLIVVIHNHNHNLKDSKNILLHKGPGSTSQESLMGKFVIQQNIHNGDHFVSSTKDYNTEEIVKMEGPNEENSVGDYHVLIPVVVNTIDDSSVVTANDWSALKDRFNALLEKWEAEKSLEHYEALQEALSYLENYELGSSGVSSVDSQYKQIIFDQNSQKIQATGIVVVEFPKEDSSCVEEESLRNRKLQENILSTVPSAQNMLQSIDSSKSSSDVDNENNCESVSDKFFLQDHGYVIINENFSGKKVLKNKEIKRAVEELKIDLER